MKSNFESMEEMQRMQQEAVRRVQEMQKRAKRSLEADLEYSDANKAKNLSQQQEIRNNSEIPGQTKDKTSKQMVNNSIKNTKSKHILNKTNGSKMNLFSELFNDKEKSLILVLILILVDESSDLSLILALIYLII